MRVRRGYDPINKLAMLQGSWISQASAEQRRCRSVLALRLRKRMGWWTQLAGTGSLCPPLDAW